MSWQICHERQKQASSGSPCYNPGDLHKEKWKVIYLALVNSHTHVQHDKCKSLSSVSHVEVPSSLLSTTIKRKTESQHTGGTPNTSNKLKAPRTTPPPVNLSTCQQDGQRIIPQGSTRSPPEATERSRLFRR